MITIKLPGEIEATVEDGVWSVPENDELARVLNDPAMQPDSWHYAPTEDARKATHVIKVWGGAWVSSDEPAAEDGLIY
jgi:hypothetical protein